MTIGDCLMLFIYEDEMFFDDLPEGYRPYAAERIEYLKNLDMVTVIHLPGAAYPVSASLTAKALNSMAELRAR